MPCMACALGYELGCECDMAYVSTAAQRGLSDPSQAVVRFGMIGLGTACWYGFLVVVKNDRCCPGNMEQVPRDNGWTKSRGLVVCKKVDKERNRGWHST